MMKQILFALLTAITITLAASTCPAQENTADAPATPPAAAQKHTTAAETVAAPSPTAAPATPAAEAAPSPAAEATPPESHVLPAPNAEACEQHVNDLIDMQNRVFDEKRKTSDETIKKIDTEYDAVKTMISEYREWLAIFITVASIGISIVAVLIGLFVKSKRDEMANELNRAREINKEIVKKGEDAIKEIKGKNKDAIESIKAQVREAGKRIDELADLRKDMKETKEKFDIELQRTMSGEGKTIDKLSPELKTEIEDIVRRIDERKETELTEDEYFFKATNENDYDRRIPILNEMIERFPSSERAYYWRADTYFNKKEYDQAIQDFGKVIKLNPHDDIAYNNRGSTFNEKGDHDRAIQDFDKAIKLNPDNDVAYNNRGFAFNEKGDHDRAIQDLDKAIKLNPKNDVAYYNRGSAFSDKGDNDRAIQDYDKAIELDPKNDSAYNNRGFAFYKTENYEQAKKDFLKAIELNPEYANAHFYLGCVYVHEGDKVKGIEMMDKCAELGYNNVERAKEMKGFQILLADEEYKERAEAVLRKIEENAKKK